MSANTPSIHLKRLTMGQQIKRKSLLTLVLLLALTWIVRAGIFDQVSLAIQSGNAKEVSRYFGSEVKLTMNDEAQVYNKTKAEIQLKNFFTQHNPRSFKIIHQGSSSQGTQYAIGNLKTNNGSFRTYVLIKKLGDRPLIKELKFERE